MATATRDDILRLFPGIQDHTVLEILAAKATPGDLEAVSMLLANQDEGLVDVKHDSSVQLSRLMDLLVTAELDPLAENNR